MPNQIPIQDIHVSLTLTSPNTPSKVLARATVVISEVFEMHGFTLQTSLHIHKKFQEAIYIQPPRVRVGDRWCHIIFCRDKKLWEEIEEKIYNEYCVLRDRYRKGV